VGRGREEEGNGEGRGDEGGTKGREGRELGRGSPQAFCFSNLGSSGHCISYVNAVPADA